MKSIFGHLTVGTLIAIAIASCWVDRKTSDYACSSDLDCIDFTPSRRCDTSLGYCVDGDNPRACPDICNSGCDMTGMSCAITCLAGLGCGDITCPDGFDCTINCANNACDSITCNGDSKCTINCIGANACNNVDCGFGDCTVVCNGSNACDNVDCNDARCDVTCIGNSACSDVDCDASCRCNVNCQVGSACDTRTCSGLSCETPQGCNPTNTGCPTTCP